MDLQKTFKKLYKTGLFHGFELKRNRLSYRDCYNNLYVLQPYKDFFMLRIGHVEEWKEYKLTFESDYNLMGLVECAKYMDHVKPMITNNPDYVKRISEAYLLN